MNSLVTIAQSARTVYERAIAVSDLISIGVDPTTTKVNLDFEFKHLATDIGQLVTRAGASSAKQSDVEEAARDLHRLAVAMRNRARLGLDVDTAEDALASRFSTLAAALGYSTEPIDEAVATKPVRPASPVGGQAA